MSRWWFRRPAEASYVFRISGTASRQQSWRLSGLSLQRYKKSYSFSNMQDTHPLPLLSGLLWYALRRNQDLSCLQPGRPKKGRPSDQQIPDSKNCLSPPHDLYGLPWSRNVHYLIEFTSRLRLLPAKERPCDLSVYRCQDMEDDIWFLLIFHDLSFSLSLLIPFPETDHAVKPSFSNGSLS